MKTLVSILLSVGLGLFLADAVVSLLDETLNVFFHVQALTFLRAFVFFFAAISAILIYLLIGLTPMVRKRYFLPLTLFNPVAALAIIPISIYQMDRLPQVAWLVSLIQVVVALGLVFWLQGGLRFKWPLVREEQLGDRAFGWLNLGGFVCANLFVVLPAVVLYFAWCGALAADHFTGGFFAVRADRLAVRAKQFVRTDGKTIHLLPMMHIGEPEFYKQIVSLIPTNSVVLLEGVTDEKKLLKAKLSYGRVAASLGLAEQQEEFVPAHGRTRRADVDVSHFSEKSIEFLNVVALIHSQGLTVDVIQTLLEKSQDPQLSNQVWEDLLTRRNEHLLKEIQSELAQTDTIVVPWGAAHMKGIAEGLESAGFRPTKVQEFDVLRYRTIWNRLRTP